MALIYFDDELYEKTLYRKLYFSKFLELGLDSGKRTSAQELRYQILTSAKLPHKSLTLAHYFFMVPKLTIQSNLVSKLTFGAEVHSLVTKWLVPNIHNPG